LEAGSRRQYAPKKFQGSCGLRHGSPFFLIGGEPFEGQYPSRKQISSSEIQQRFHCRKHQGQYCLHYPLHCHSHYCYCWMCFAKSLWSCHPLVLRNLQKTGQKLK